MLEERWVLEEMWVLKGGGREVGRRKRGGEEEERWVLKGGGREVGVEEYYYHLILFVCVL